MNGFALESLRNRGRYSCSIYWRYCMWCASFTFLVFGSAQLSEFLIESEARRAKFLVRQSKGLTLETSANTLFTAFSQHIHINLTLIHCTYTLYFLFAPCKRIRNPESSKFLLLESRIHRFGMESGIQKVGIRNPKGWNPESRSWDPESRGWDPESRTFVDSLTWGDLV